jgi:DNA-binding transcriptional LysR family regulator
MRRLGFQELSAFAAIAKHRSFRKAAHEIGVSPSTLSHMMRTLEERVGVRLLHRTTRSVTTTEAGERLVARAGPLLRDLDHALEEVNSFRGAPRGTVRINAPAAARYLLFPRVIPRFRERYPDVHLDLFSESRSSDIVAGGFDAGIRLRESVPADMVAVPLGSVGRYYPVATRAYLKRNGTPRSPDDLLSHACVRFRLPSGKIYRWEFMRRGEELALDVKGPITTDDAALMLDFALAGLGVAFVAHEMARDHIKARRLVMLLDDWCPEFPGACLYYPGHRHVPPALRALIDVIKQR